MIYENLELMQRIRRPSALQVLNQIQYLFDARERRLLCKHEGGIELGGMEAMETQEYLELMRLTKLWLQPIVRVDFKGVKRGKNQSSNHANAGRKSRRSKRNLRT